MTHVSLDICGKTISCDPDHFDDVRLLAQRIRDDLDELGFARCRVLELDENLRSLAAGKTEMPILGSHPVYQYLAEGYGLNIKSVHFEPDEVPSGEAWQDLEHLLSEHPAKWMLWEDEPLPEAAAKLEGVGLSSVVFNPCGNRPQQGDFLSVMKNNLTNLEISSR